MRNFLLLIVLFTLASFQPLAAQEFSGGFRAGLNFASFSGDLETSADGTTTFEEYKESTGFHVGATFALAFTDLVGIKADLMYSQKGGERRFNGPSYFYLYSGVDDTEGEVNFAIQDAQINIVNSYIDIPLVGYYRIGILELEAGASMGFLVNSQASGGKTYTGSRLTNNPIVFNVEGSFSNDDAAGAGIINNSTTTLPGALIPLPGVISAYYNHDNNGKLYRGVDFALVGGINVFLNNGLFVGGRYQYGLTDLTRPENDLRLANETQVGGREYNTDDKDYSRVFQASIGFRF